MSMQMSPAPLVRLTNLLLCAVSKRGLAGANGAGMADVMAWLKKEGGPQDA
jgi:hypothetical protein